MLPFVKQNMFFAGFSAKTSDTILDPHHSPLSVKSETSQLLPLVIIPNDRKASSIYKVSSTTFNSIKFLPRNKGPDFLCPKESFSGSPSIASLHGQAFLSPHLHILTTSALSLYPVHKVPNSTISRPDTGLHWRR